MKKIILSAILLGSMAVGANAQANSILVYGNLSIGTETDAAKNHEFNFGINPGVGYQFDNHWTVGLTGGFNTTRDRADKADDWNYENTYSVAPFLRYTQGLGKIFAVYGQLEVGYQGQTDGVTNNNDSKVSANGVYASLTPYIGINVYRGFALNFQFGGLGFSSMKVKDADNSDNSFGLTFGKQFSVGVSKNFGGHPAMRHHRHPRYHGDSNHNNHSDMNTDDDSNDSDN